MYWIFTCASSTLNILFPLWDSAVDVHFQGMKGGHGCSVAEMMQCKIHVQYDIRWRFSQQWKKIVENKNQNRSKHDSFNYLCLMFTPHFFYTIVNSNSPLKAWPCAVWQEIAAAWRQDATYHQGTRWLFNFTPPVAKTPVSVEHHNGSYAGGADVLVKGCKEGGGWVGRRTAKRSNGGGGVCVCRVVCTVAVYCTQSTVWPCAHAQINSASAFRTRKNSTNKNMHCDV